MKITADILAIVKAGASITFDGSAKITPDLLTIVKAATHVGQIVTIKNVGNKITPDLVAIAKAGGVHVVLEL